MPDSRFFKNNGELTLKQVMDITGSVYLGDTSEGIDTAANEAVNTDAATIKETKITGINSIGEAGAQEATFIEDKKLLDLLVEKQSLNSDNNDKHSSTSTAPAACFIKDSLAEEFHKRISAKGLSPQDIQTVLLITSKPQLAFSKLAHHIHIEKCETENNLQVHSSANISDTAKIGKNCSIAPGVVIEDNAEIGEGCIVESNAVIGKGVVLGDNCKIGKCASVEYSIIGSRVYIYAGARIGQDGFGFVMSEEGHTKIPQLGRVIIEDDVEIGANTTVDRGAIGDTVIGQGTKIDNLCQIAHNVKIGKHCVFAAFAGVSGSVEFGDFVAAGGAAGFKDHIKIGTGARIAASAGVTRDVKAGETVSGMPARDIKEHMKQVAALRKLALNKTKNKTANKE